MVETIDSIEMPKDFPYGEGLPNTLFRDNRLRFIKNVKSRLGDSLAKNGLALFKGNGETHLYNSDVDYPFYQEASFYYLFGVNYPDCYGVIDFENEDAVIFIPKLSNLYKIWMTVLSKEDFEKKYEIKTRYLDELP